MNKILLTKREYLGKTNIHVFENTETKEILPVECTDEEYKSLSLPNPTNPQMEEYIWKYSAGEIIKVDTPKIEIQEGEYCLIGGNIFTILRDKDGRLKVGEFTEQEINTYGYSI